MMNRSNYWMPRLELQKASQSTLLDPLTFERGLRGVSDAALVHCSDGNDYVVKSIHNGRRLIPERVVSLLAEALQFPAPKCALINIDAELIQELDEKRRTSWAPGVAHGSLWLTGVTDGNGIAYHSSTLNRQRFADIALLYGMTIPGEDYQFLYGIEEPHLVRTFDHGFFMDMVRPWSSPTARGYMERNLRLDQRILAAVTASAQMISSSRSKLHLLTDEALTQAIGSIPQEWGITDEERCVLCEYLCIMRDRFDSMETIDSRTA